MYARARICLLYTSDIIFFDWEGDGTTDHVGIVEKCENGTVYTVEGNSGAVSYTHLEATRFLIQLDHARFQPGGFHKGLKEKVQLIRLAVRCV